MSEKFFRFTKTKYKFPTDILLAFVKSILIDFEDYDFAVSSPLL